MYLTCLFQLSKYFSVLLVLHNFIVNFPNKIKAIWKNNKISETHAIERYFLSIIIDCRKLFYICSGFPVISSINILYDFVRRKNIVSG